MQGKIFILLRTAKFLVALLFICSQFLMAEVKSDQENKDKDNSKEAIIFDSCNKESNKKCEPEKKVPIPDYSKSLK